MNEKKLKQLFAAARNETAPQLPPGFAEDIVRMVRCEPAPSRAGASSVWDHLNRLFPRLAVAAAVIIALCFAADWALTAAGVPGVSESASQATSQDLFTLEDL